MRKPVAQHDDTTTTANYCCFCCYYYYYDDDDYYFLASSLDMPGRVMYLSKMPHHQGRSSAWNTVAACGQYSPQPDDPSVKA